MTTRARRSCLVVPGTSERMLAKAAHLPADEVILDLEDAVPPAEKNEATRRLVATMLSSQDWAASTRAVRVNAVDSAWFEDDVTQLLRHAGDAIHAFVLPKVESAADVVAAAALIDGLGANVALEVQIESARGLVNVEQIAAASPRLEALVFGPGDYAASLGLPQLDIGSNVDSYPGDLWQYPRSRIAVAAHAFGLDAIDGPFAAIRDEEGLRESARRARMLGCTGKWVVHPDQIVPCNELFSPSADEVARAERLLDALREARLQGNGTAELDGMMIDEASQRMAKALVERARAGGIR
jgi:citrate lyase subunit beta / citryl-CoA lyase